MNKFKTINILLIFIFIPLILCGQNLNYPVKKINGNEYYIYTVEAQEGLYSVSKKFGVKQSDISAMNPEVKDGLKAGQVLIVPKHNTITKIDESKKTASKVEFIEHVVLKKQTLFSISNTYNIPIDSIKKYNPQLENNGLREGDKLRIPTVNGITENKTVEKKKSGSIFDIFKKKSDNKKPATIVEGKTTTDYILHKVKKNETLFSISKLYNVDIEDIVKLNPETEISVKIDSEIKIPKKGVNVNGSEASNGVSKIENQNNEEKISVSNDKFNNKFGTIKIAFLVPLMLEQTKVDATNEKFVDFYAGSLLAINEAKKRGISFEIYTFDTEKSEIKMGEILNNPDLKKVDLIIGPAYTNQVAMIGDFARVNKINTLIPFTSKIYDIDTNPYLLQFNPAMSYELKFMTDLMKSKFKKSKIIFAELPDVNTSDNGFEYVSLLKKELTKQNRNYSVVEITNTESVDFSNYLSADENNLIIFNTERYANINQIFTGLKSQSETFKINYFSQLGWPEVNENSKIKRFYISPFNNINSSDYIKYRNSFASNFNWTTSESVPSYDLLGYDLTQYFISLYIQNGTQNFTGLSKLPDGQGIQSEFKFERYSKNSGFINTQLYITEK